LGLHAALGLRALGLRVVPGLHVAPGLRVALGLRAPQARSSAPSSAPKQLLLLREEAAIQTISAGRSFLGCSNSYTLLWVAKLFSHKSRET
jgi:hypothetical protein